MHQNVKCGRVEPVDEEPVDEAPIIHILVHKIVKNEQSLK